MKAKTAKIIGGISFATGAYGVFRYFWMLKVYLEFLNVMDSYVKLSTWETFSELPNEMLGASIVLIALGLIAMKHKTQNLLAAKILFGIWSLGIFAIIALIGFLIFFGFGGV